MSIGGLFGQSPDAIQIKFKLRKKHKDAHVRILAYLDDWLLVVSSRERATLPLPLTLMHIQALGFCVNLQKKIYDHQLTVFLPQVRNRFHLRLGTPVKAQGGGISLQSHSILVGMQTAFPNNFTADRHDGVNDHSVTQAVKDASNIGHYVHVTSK